MPKVCAIIPAAGAGRRFGADGNKIFQRIGGEPVFIRTLEMFASRPEVIQTLLVTSAADTDEMSRLFASHLKFLDARCVVGGATRTESVRNALEKVCDAAELVCVHDAVRPCVSPVWIDEVFQAAERTGAAILACRLHGTLKAVGENNVVGRTLPRQAVWEAQTPQVFEKELLRRAYASGEDATDDADLVERLGHPVTVVEADPRNVKITTPADLEFARAIISTLPKPTPQPRPGRSEPAHG